ncbi:CLUMA_CG016249, isoform B [Clunio marinus]|uniref:CLUMA_CG016249, isoform B n=1 Tax=Clunio marinus TaxID=568069 RepID=A0A1J1IV31_9DIPT|nr:CLUMA_CG016249, isoform B [Clunio marinus]
MQHYNHSNGQHSPNSSHMSMHSEDTYAIAQRTHKQQTTQQVTTVTKVVREVKHLGPADGEPLDYVAMPLQVGPNGQPVPVDYVMGVYPPHSQYMNYNHMDPSAAVAAAAAGMYVGDPGAGGGQYHPHYQDYEQYPAAGQYANSNYPGSGGSVSGGNGLEAVGPNQSYLSKFTLNERATTPPSPSEHASSNSPHQLAGVHHQVPQGAAGVAYLQAQYDDYRITPSPGGALDRGYADDPAALVYGYVSTSPYGTTNVAALQPIGAGGVNPTYDTRGFAVTAGVDDEDDELQKHMANLSMHNHQLGGVTNAGDDQSGVGQMRWRDPNLTEVISFLNNPNNVIKANAAAYLQHLCYMDDPNKQRTRALGGIPILVKLLGHESPEVYRNASGALRNLSYGRQNDENKRAIKNANGIPALINLLRRSTESDIKELITGVIWNMSSCEDLKRSIIDDGCGVIVTYIIIPHSGWDPINPGDTCWSTVFRNASGILRNVSSAGEYARTKLREAEGLIDALLYVVKMAIEKTNIGNKIVENCVCILRNLSYRCQEVEDPNYDKHPLPQPTRSSATTKSENLGCFGASKKKKDQQNSSTNGDGKDGPVNMVGSNGGIPGQSNGAASSSGNSLSSRNNSLQRNDPPKGYELLWQPEVVQSYLALLQSCSNPETLEAAAGALQNLAACYWQPSIEIRAAVRKDKGLPILVELLRMEVDRVVCAVATALRNLAIDQRNKELIGKYAMRDLVQKLPSGNAQHDQGTSDDTIAAVLATLNEVIKKNAEFSRSLLDAGGVERLMNITRQRQKYTPRVLKFAGQVLFTMWQHQDLRDVYKKHGWKEQDFVTKTIAARNAAPNSPNNVISTLNRPMASQSGTRYEDSTMKRQPGGGHSREAGNASGGTMYQRRVWKALPNNASLLRDW